MRETARDGKRSPSDARASARGRSVEMVLDVGRFSLDFQDHVRGEEESCVKQTRKGGEILVVEQLLWRI